MYLKWPVPQVFVDSPEVEYRNTYFRRLANMPIEEVAVRCTELSVAEMAKLVELAQQTGGIRLTGTGLEAGAGCGLLSAVCASQPGVQRMYAVEACEEAARLVIPQVAKDVLNGSHARVVPVFGTFDDFELPDNTLDFLVEIHSYHHSHDLPGTVKEAFRVLKPGGVLIAFDRCHPNTVTDDQVKMMLAKVYGKEFLRHNCYPEDIVLTRAENGEHEYRQFEWEGAFKGAGFKIEKQVKFQRALDFKAPMRAILRAIPGIGSRFSYARTSDIGKWLKQKTGAVPIGPRETTLFVLRKPA